MSTSINGDETDDDDDDRPTENRIKNYNYKQNNISKKNIIWQSGA